MWAGWAATRSSQALIAGIARQVEAAFVCHVRVRVERDVGDRVAPAYEELELSEMSFHRG